MKFLWSLLFVVLVLTCSCSAEKPSKCLASAPKGTGLCYKLAIGYTYDADKNECVKYSESGCTIEGENNFGTEEDCKKTCVDK